MQEEQKVDDFYRDGQILVTGGTGFMGKLLIDKLLRSFPDIGAIYIMVRDKKGSSPEERVKNMLNSVVSLAINGLLTYVSTAFCHAKMTSTIEEKIYQPQTSYRTLIELLDLSPNDPKLEELKVNSGPQVARNQTSYRTLIELLDLSPDDPKLEELKVKFAKENANTYCLTKAAAEQLLAEEGQDIPSNTYCLTKAAAEQLLAEEGQDIPVSIFRPAIVISTWKDPVPGWIDNLYGPTGIVTGVEAGLIRTVHCNPNVTGDMVPADLTTNSLVCSAWDASNRADLTTNALMCSAWDASNRIRKLKTTSLPIYNYVSSKDNPITWLQFQTKCFNAGVKTPPSQVLMYIFPPLQTKSRNLYIFLSFFLHYLVGYVFDFFFWASGQKMRLIPIYKRLDKASDALQPFSPIPQGRCEPSQFSALFKRFVVHRPGFRPYHRAICSSVPIFGPIP
ncbi:fatty acyl-CoA reductase wat-like [Diaphorina citri]|uniref:Fatty acyl-CoA reductase n=1 Tax=Diaphorina citri TaxID=121845 RepID=A0A3Q0JG40_DIACI|nr:fatty acyl-CoA reductase wat-like [Diaphorina citri]